MRQQILIFYEIKMCTQRCNEDIKYPFIIFINVHLFSVKIQHTDHLLPIFAKYKHLFHPVKNEENTKRDGLRY